MQREFGEMISDGVELPGTPESDDVDLMYSLEPRNCLQERKTTRGPRATSVDGERVCCTISAGEEDGTGKFLPMKFKNLHDRPELLVRDGVRKLFGGPAMAEETIAYPDTAAHVSTGVREHDNLATFIPMKEWHLTRSAREPVESRTPPAKVSQHGWRSSNRFLGGTHQVPERPNKGTRPRAHWRHPIEHASQTLEFTFCKTLSFQNGFNYPQGPLDMFGTSTEFPVESIDNYTEHGSALRWLKDLLGSNSYAKLFEEAKSVVESTLGFFTRGCDERKVVDVRGNETFESCSSDDLTDLRGHQRREARSSAKPEREAPITQEFSC